MGMYKITDQYGGIGGLDIQFKITDLAIHLLCTMNNTAKEKFAFTMQDYDMFEVCFESKGSWSVGQECNIHLLSPVDMITYILIDFTRDFIDFESNE
ncbi:hypothetical protein STEG23_017828 [Scotinomys teguina]